MIWPFKNKNKPEEKRNYSIAYRVQPGQPVYSNWTVLKATKEGYKASPWVYRAVFVIAKSIASVPWYVCDENGERVEGHHLNQLFRFPNPAISRQDVFELIASWLGLAGNSYLIKNIVGGRTTELWPVSPDRLKPVAGRAMDEWCAGYALDESSSVSYLPEQVIHHKFFNPANPLLGIAPLEAVGKAVDADIAMQNFNAATMQSRGVIDGVFTFEREFVNQNDADAVSDRIKEKYGEKRGFLVLGSNAKYQRLGMTQAEMDFNESRRSTRDEILLAFGVPPQLVGVTEASTYNNYQTSQLIFWSSTVIPWLDDIEDGFNFSFRNELQENQYIKYDLSAVQAIQDAQLDRSETAKNLSEMGVPFEQINRLFEFGVDEYPGWDMPIVKSGNQQTEQRSHNIIIMDDLAHEIRTLNSDISENERKFIRLLSDQKNRVFNILDKVNSIEALKEYNFEDIISSDADAWERTLSGIFLNDSIKYGKQVKISGKRSIEAREDLTSSISQEIANYLVEEGVILREKSLIDAATVDTILTKIAQGTMAGMAINDLQTSILDSGIFSPERALRISRTVTGSAQMTGQYFGAKIGGAQRKVWRTAGHHVRRAHTERENETREINERFTPKYGATVGPMYPMDVNMPASDRINCRCSLSYFTE